MTSFTTERQSLPGVKVLPGYTPEREYASETKVWEDGGKLFVRILVKNDHPFQVVINTLGKTYDAYGYD